MRPTEITTPYHYQAVRRDKLQICLFKIVSISRGLAQTTLEIFNLAEAPPFVALSYTWGPPEPVQPLAVGSSYLAIRQNLFDFFALHAHKHVGTYIWADQICIDQNNIHEVNAQVQMMDSIYSAARKVIVWLGRDPDNGLILHFFKTIEENEKRYAAMDRLAALPYWTRLWVVQEIILARELQLVYGHGDITPQYVGPSAATELLVLAQRNASTRKLEWRDVMELSRKSQCADLRDKVYGIQSLLASELRIEVDYMKSTREVFLDAAVLYEQHISKDIHFEAGILDLAIGMDLVDRTDWYNWSLQSKFRPRDDILIKEIQRFRSRIHEAPDIEHRICDLRKVLSQCMLDLAPR